MGGEYIYIFFFHCSLVDCTVNSERASCGIFIVLFSLRIVVVLFSLSIAAGTFHVQLFFNNFNC